MQASARANAKIRMNLQALAMQGLMQAQKYRLKLPWANLDADGGMEYERGNKRDDESDPKLFSMDEYEHTSATDDADIAEDEPFQDDSLNQPDDSELKDGDDDNSDPE